MDFSELKVALLDQYNRRDVEGIIRVVDQFKKSSEFPALCQRLAEQGKINFSTTKTEEIARALLDIIEEKLEADGGLTLKANFFEISEILKKKYNQELADIYLSIKMPSDFLMKIRMESDRSDSSKLSESLVEAYKNELIRTEKARRVIVDLIQSFNHFPIENVKTLNDLINHLHLTLKSNYKYLSVKPYFLSLVEIGGSADLDDDLEADSEAEVGGFTLFKHYLNTGEEPALIQQVQFHIAVDKLFKFLKNQQLLSDTECNQYAGIASGILEYRGATEISAKARRVFDDLLCQINIDLQAIDQRLAYTFIDEYHCAEEQMRMRHSMIEYELAYTNEYLNQIASTLHSANSRADEKVSIAMEKTVLLKEVFTLSPHKIQVAAEKSLAELERTALGLSTAVGANQLTDWIKVYSIIFSNADFLAHSEKEIDFSIMRKLISDLTSFHLIQNIAQLKMVVDRAMHAAAEEEKISYFKKINKNLKEKLKSLMGSETQRKPGVKGSLAVQDQMNLRKMIDELDFLKNESTQFVIAETFEGFQIIVDAFNKTVNDYFVRDRDALMKESRGLYNDICNKCMVGFENQAAHRSQQEPVKAKKQKKSWLGKLFS